MAAIASKIVALRELIQNQNYKVKFPNGLQEIMKYLGQDPVSGEYLFEYFDTEEYRNITLSFGPTEVSQLYFFEHHQMAGRRYRFRKSRKYTRRTKRTKRNSCR